MFSGIKAGIENSSIQISKYLAILLLPVKSVSHSSLTIWRAFASNSKHMVNSISNSINLAYIQNIN